VEAGEVHSSEVKTMGQPPPPRAGRPHEAEQVAPLASTGAGALAVQFVTALSKAARSFTLYAPTNAVVRQFLADYQARAAEATAAGDLVLDVHPFEMVRDGEVVYREADRERSLAFRLFRDGVRRLTFRPGVPWGELLGFLEILAVRYAGIRQQEEDVITLLRKGEFQGIGFTAVEGFTPEEDNPEPERARRARGEGSRAPAGFDAPFPLLPPPGPITWRAVPGKGPSRWPPTPSSWPGSCSPRLGAGWSRRARCSSSSWSCGTTSSPTAPWCRWPAWPSRWGSSPRDRCATSW
jgi:hypothetical protein